MENTAQNYSHQENYTAANDNDYNVAANDLFYDPNFDNNRKLKSNGLIAVSDIHGNYDSLRNVYSIAKEKDLSVIINGDAVNDYHFKEFANELGYRTQQDLFLEYASQRLDEKDTQTLLFSQQYSQVQSLDPFLQQVPESQKSQAKKQLEDILSYADSGEFREKFEQTAYGFKEEKEHEVIENQFGLNSLYHVFMEEEAKRLADEINNYDVETIFNLGNHEHAFFTKQVREYLNDPSKLVDATNHKGYISIEQDNGQEITLAGMTNCAQIMPYLQDVVFSEQEYQLLTHHMNIDDARYQTLLKGDVSQDELSSLEDKIRQDPDYHRIIQNQEKPLDIFLTHGQVGKVMTNNNTGFDVPYLGVAAYFSNLADLTIEGHIHSKYDGKNSFGNDMIRVAGADATIISKNDEGLLEKEWITIDNSFDGNHHNEIPYTLDYMKKKVDSRIKLLRDNEELLAANDDEDEQKQAA